VNEKTKIEKATEAVVHSINDVITTHHRIHQLHPEFREAEFRRILALYFQSKTLKDWCHDLGIPVPPGSPD